MGLSAREAVERHAKAVIEGKYDVVMGDLMPEVAANIQPVAEAFVSVQPTAYEIVEEQRERANWIFRVKYVGEKSYFLVKSTWALKDEDWKVIAAEKE